MFVKITVVNLLFASRASKAPVSLFSLIPLILNNCHSVGAYLALYHHHIICWLCSWFVISVISDLIQFCSDETSFLFLLRSELDILCNDKQIIVVDWLVRTN